MVTGYAGAESTPEPTPEPTLEPTPEVGNEPANVDDTVDDHENPCPGAGDAPTPTAVEVTAVPIVVTSTTDEYFVLYVNFDVDGETVELPVSVTKGEAGTTTLPENVEALPKERYRVEKYLIDDPADVDAIAPTTSPNSRLGIRRPTIRSTPADGSRLGDDLTDGAVAIPDQTTFDTLAFDFFRRSYVKIILFGMDTDNPGVYFTNTNNYTHHQSFIDAFAADVAFPEPLIIRYGPDLVAPDGSMGAYYWSQWTDFSFSNAAPVYAVLAANMPVLEDNLYLHVTNAQLGSVRSNLDLYRESRIDLVFDEDIVVETNFAALNPAVGYGRLRVMEPDERPLPRDVVIYETLPNELPVSQVSSPPPTRRRSRM